MTTQVHPLELNPPQGERAATWLTQALELKTRLMDLTDQTSPSPQDYEQLWSDARGHLSTAMSALDVMHHHMQAMQSALDHQDLLHHMQVDLLTSTDTDTDVLAAKQRLEQTLDDAFDGDFDLNAFKVAIPSDMMSNRAQRVANLWVQGLGMLATVTHETLYMSRLGQPQIATGLTADTSTSLAFERWATTLHTTTYQKVRELYAALLHESTETLASTVSSLYLNSQTLVDIHAQTFGRYLALERQGLREADYERDISSSIRAVEAFELLGVLGCASARLVGLTRGVEVQEELNTWRDKAQNLPFVSARPMGRRVGAAQVDDQQEDDLVHLEGVIRAIDFRPDPAAPKMSTFLTLREGTRGTDVIVRAHMFDLRSSQVQVGSAMELVGHVKLNASWGNQGVGLELDRLSLTEMATQSWLDWMIQSHKSWYVVWADNFNAIWTPPL